MLAEARQALPRLREDALRAAGPEGVRRVVGRRLALLPAPQMVEGEWDAWWDDYFDALAGLPESALEAAMQAYVRQPDSEFMPKPGKLRALALATPNQATRAFERASAAIRHAEPKPLEIGAPERPAASKVDVDAMLAGFRAEMSARRAARVRPERPPVSAKIDETGISADMRRRLDEMRR